MFKLHLISELKEAFISLTARQLEGYHAGHGAQPLNPPLKKMVLHDRKCTGCGACAAMCPAHAITALDNKKHRTVTISLNNCIYCGVCVAICPEKALELVAGNDLPALAKDKLYHELKIRLRQCEHCQTTIGTVKGIAQAVKNSYAQRGLTPQELSWIMLCAPCRRKFHRDRLVRHYGP